MPAGAHAKTALPQTTLDAAAATLSARLHGVSTDQLQAQTLQDELDGAQYDNDPRDPQAAFDATLAFLEDFFRSKKEAVNRVAERAEELHTLHAANPPTSMPAHNSTKTDRLRMQPDFAYDATYGQYLSREGSRTYFPERSEVLEAPSTWLFTEWSAELDPLFAEVESSDAFARWVYVASEEGGLYRGWPGKEWTLDFRNFHKAYEPRLRPWFLAATSGVKRVAIALDASDSMTIGARWSHAKAVVSRILDSLGNDDSVMLVVYGGNRAYVPECLASGYVAATPTIVKRIRDIVETINPWGFTRMNEALNLVYDHTPDHCNSYVHVVTDMDDIDPDSFYYPCSDCGPTFYKVDWERMSNGLVTQCDRGGNFHAWVWQVHSSGDVDEELGAHMACTCEGAYVGINSTHALRDKMSTYFRFLAESSDNTDVTWSPPYIDASGLGALITAARPYFDHSESPPSFLGVAALDASLTDLQRELRKREWGDAQFMLVDLAGSAIIHPAQQELSDFIDLPLFDSLLDLEMLDGTPASFLTDVWQPLMRGETGTAEMTVSRMLPAGDVSFEGQRRRAVHTTYHFGSIPDASFRLILATRTTSDSTAFREVRSPPAPATRQFYHLLDVYLRDDPDTAALLDIQRAGLNEDPLHREVTFTDEASTVKGAGVAFCEPSDYYHTVEGGDWVAELNAELNGGDQAQFCTATRFTREFLTDVRVSAPLEAVWKAEDDPNIVWRYYGSASGLFRVYPGSPLPQNYTATTRPWYERATAEPDVLAVSTPYLDQLGAGKVVTLSTVIADGVEVPATGCAGASGRAVGCACSDHAECATHLCHSAQCRPQTARGVLGLDFTYNDFHSIFEESTASACGADGVRCFLIDRNGYLIAHDMLLSQELSEARRFEHVPMGRYEPGTVQAMLAGGVVTKTSFINFQAVCDRSVDGLAVQPLPAEAYVDPRKRDATTTAGGVVMPRATPVPKAQLYEIEPYSNKTNCVKRVETMRTSESLTYWTSEIADSCTRAAVAAVPVPNTNLLLVALSEEEAHPPNFQCMWIEAGLSVPFSRPVVGDCSSDSVPVHGVCGVKPREDVEPSTCVSYVLQERKVQPWGAAALGLFITAVIVYAGSTLASLSLPHLRGVLLVFVALHSMLGFGPFPWAWHKCTISTAEKLDDVSFLKEQRTVTMWLGGITRSEGGGEDYGWDSERCEVNPSCVDASYHAHAAAALNAAVLAFLLVSFAMHVRRRNPYALLCGAFFTQLTLVIVMGTIPRDFDHACGPKKLLLGPMWGTNLLSLLMLPFLWLGAGIDDEGVNYYTGKKEADTSTSTSTSTSEAARGRGTSSSGVEMSTVELGPDGVPSFYIDDNSSSSSSDDDSHTAASAAPVSAVAANDLATIKPEPVQLDTLEARRDAMIKAGAKHLFVEPDTAPKALWDHFVGSDLLVTFTDPEAFHAACEQAVQSLIESRQAKASESEGM